MGKHRRDLVEYKYLIHYPYRHQDCEGKKIPVMNRISQQLALLFLESHLYILGRTRDDHMPSYCQPQISQKCTIEIQKCP